MENREIAIRLSGVKKMYKLGQISGGTLTADLQSWWARIRGKEDPNTQIGTNQRLIGQTFMALNGIDLTVYKGEALGIIGSNGAGKSTMLKLLSRVTAPTEGAIGINGRIASMLEVGTGFSPEMTGRENVYMNGAILGMTKAEIDAKMDQIIEFSEVGDFIDTPVKRYSSGMYVKLAFSVAAHLDSEIMIMDEVLAVGDVAFQNKCLKKMCDLSNTQGKTVLYVSHNMNTIRQLCDRCIVLDKGKVIYDGEPEEAIKIYMGYGRDVSPYDIWIQDDKRGGLYTNPKVKFLRILMKNKSGIYSFGDMMHLEMLLENTLDKDVTIDIRIVVNSDAGIGVMMSRTQTPFVIPANHKYTKCFKLDISNLVPGKYTLAFVLLESGNIGTEQKFDTLQDIYSFAVTGINNFNRNGPWHTRFWGYICNGYLQEDT